MSNAVAVKEYVKDYEKISKEKLEMKFNFNIVELLGSQLYTTLPPIISEFVSNSYDADATETEVVIIEDDCVIPKKTDIIIMDNGSGIAISKDNCIFEINERFLQIGRKRRKDENVSISPIFKRKLQGKKGIGKLAGFGITERIEITTTTQGVTNSFLLDISEMRETSGIYNPKILVDNKNIGNSDGTIVKLIDIKSSSKIDLSTLSENIVKRLQIFDNNFSLILKHRCNDIVVNEIKLSNDEYIDYVKKEKKLQFSWKIPDELENLGISTEVKEFFLNNSIYGEIFTTETPLKKQDQGIILYANNKLCQENYSFNERANDNFYSYLFGYINIDYIDKDINSDNISTSRDSLVWENPISQELRNNIDLIIKKIQVLWREKRKQGKKESISCKLKIDVDSWIKGLNAYERKSAQKIVDTVLNDDSIGDDKTVEYIGYIQDMYSYTSFKDFAESLISDEEMNVAKVLNLIKKWGMIEAKELARVASGRITTIEKFETIINNDESEREVIQPFLEKFPWILDPKINEFKREVTFSKILKEKFPDDQLDEKNRRIDFLCLLVNDEINVIELKKPSIKIDEKYHNQIYRYQEFVSEKYPNYRVKTTLISDNWSCDRGVQKMLDSAIKSNDFSLKSYSELLLEAKNYNKDLISVYEEIYKNKEETI